MNPSRTLLARLVLAAASALGFFLALEGLTRVLLPPPAPLRLRDGLYVSQLPLVDGRGPEQGGWVPKVDGPSLPALKQPGELRVFVFGESSVQGEPWGYNGSPVAMLYDQLRARRPGVTVVNMGRGASFMRDAYYYLLSVRRFSPDVVVFYLGDNERYDQGGELCLPGAAPGLHRLWRAAVSRSRLLWTLRTQGPRLLAGRGGSADRGGGPGCDGAAAFGAWADILVSAAASSGARVIVTTPVHNGLHDMEPNARDSDLAAVLSGAGRDYRGLLACLLRDGCGLLRPWRRVVSGEEPPEILRRAQAWRRAASRRGAALVDFAALIDGDGRGAFLPPYVLEEVHLSLPGNWLLARLWADAVLGAPPVSPAAALATFDRAVYARAVAADRGDYACILLRPALWYWSHGSVALGTAMLRDAAAHGEAGRDSTRAAAALLGQLRARLGLPSRLPAALEPLAARLDAAQVERHAGQGCAGVLDP